MQTENKKTFTLFWLTGNSEIVAGTDIANSMNRAGIGAGALRALDFWAHGDERNKWEWDSQNRSWKSKQTFIAKNK